MLEKSILLKMKNAYNLRDNCLKFSYFILKPNSVIHYNYIINELKKEGFNINAQYAIRDYYTINMLLHEGQINAKKYLIPISKLYMDFYGNYAILLLVSKTNINYADFCTEVSKFKKEIREKLKYDYFSYVFDISKIGANNMDEKLEIFSSSGRIIKKDSMNTKGTFMIFSINEIHSPDATLDSNIKEMMLLLSLNIFNDNNIIPKDILEKIIKYKTFEFIKDMK